MRKREKLDRIASGNEDAQNVKKKISSTKIFSLQNNRDRDCVRQRGRVKYRLHSWPARGGFVTGLPVRPARTLLSDTYSMCVCVCVCVCV